MPDTVFSEKLLHLENENFTLKEIIKAALYEHEVCYICSKKGQILHNCNCVKDEECIQNMLKLYENKKENC